VPLRDEDRRLWQSVMQNVQPLNQKQRAEYSPPASIKKSPQPQIPHHTWDLHGMTLPEAHQLALSKIHNNTQFNSMLFITGKSGQIQQEFEHWVQNCKTVQKVVPERGGGSFRVYFKKT